MPRTPPLPASTSRVTILPVASALPRMDGDHDSGLCDARLSEQLGRMIVESSRDCIKTISLDGRLLTINDAAADLLAVADLRTLIGRSWIDFWPEQDRALVRQQLDTAIAGGRGRFVGAFEVNGEMRWWDVMVTPMRGADGQPEKLLAVSRDITEQRLAADQLQRSEEALRRSESLFRQLADSMPQMVWAAQPDGTVDYYNRRWYEYTGVAESSGEGSWPIVVHPEDFPRSRETFRAAIESEKLYEVEYRLKEGATGVYRWFLGRALPIRDEAGKVIRWFGTCTDIDDHKGAEERLERAVAERTETLRETIAELESFSYSISHDLRGPLRSMQGFAELLAEDFSGVLGDEGCNYLARIRTAARHMDRLIQDVLTISHAARADLTLAPVHLDALVPAIIESYPALLAWRDNIQILGPLSSVKGNDAALTQCFSNLLGNAVKFVRPENAPFVRIWAEPRGKEMVRVWIEDNGIGIPSTAHEKIFRIFERMDSAYEGNGIGLAIVKTTVIRLGGRVGLESSPGQGSRFWVELQQAEPSANQPGISRG